MTPLVLLPGMMCDARLFAPQIAAFEGARPVHVLPITEADTVQDLARLVLDRAPDRFALGGLSMGGIVAMEVIRQAPDRIAGAAFLDTNPKAEVPEVAAMRDPQMAKALAGELRAVMRDEMKPLYLADGPNKPAILALCMQMAEDLGPEVFVRQSRALASRPDQQDTLRTVSVPTLALCGAEDALCPVHRHELIRDLVPGARLEIIPNAGHLPTLEQPDATNAALRRWLEAV
ncbi:MULTISPECIES: alpha/beta fold hydrolase [unclassified Meridianimarinicoccus]|uniref:alpha/beta fold hydrolase n=1 Tax=unclassified Meridianimarinicoccus TaxID=2923344 RepID=UPI0018661047|nr:alpha/beta fold hydrolase [Fluviibacterium sp. MJW13]